MKRKTTALFSILAVMLFLAACATTGSGSDPMKWAELTIPDCLE